MQGKSLGTSVISVTVILNIVAAQREVMESGTLGFGTGAQSTLQHSAVDQSSAQISADVQPSATVEPQSHTETVIPQMSATNIQPSTTLKQSSAAIIQPSATFTQMSATILQQSKTQTSTIIQASATIKQLSESEPSVILTKPIVSSITATFMDLQSSSAISKSPQFGYLETITETFSIMPTQTQDFSNSKYKSKWTQMEIIQNSTLQTPVMISTAERLSTGTISPIATSPVHPSSILDSSTIKNSSMWSPIPSEGSSISTVKITTVTSNPCQTAHSNTTSPNNTLSPQEVNCTLGSTSSPVQAYPSMQWSLAAIIGTILGIASFILIIGGIVAFMLYCRHNRRKIEMNKDTTTSYGFSYFSTNWSDSVTSLNYLSTNIPLPKENEDEMVSVDDDAFLNSLDSSTFANFWNDPKMKNTRV